MEKIYGKHSVRAVFLMRPRAIKRLILLSGDKPALEEFAREAKNLNIEPEYLPWKEFLKATQLTQEEKHQGICIFAESRHIFTEKDLSLLQNSRLVLALDQISNPQNLATIIRSAAFFGVDAILLLKNRSADLSPTVLRIAVGGTEYVKIFKVINLARSLEKLKAFGYWVYGLDERGENVLSKTEFDEKTVLVIGAEGEGLRLRTSKFCDQLVRIQGGRQGLESLNAGVAAALAMAEVFRRFG